MAKAKKRKQQKKSVKAPRSKWVSAEQFIPVWNEAATAEQAAKKLGMSVSAAQQRASKLRKRGVKPLQMFPTQRGLKPLDIAALSKLAQSTFKKKQATA